MQIRKYFFGTYISILFIGIFCLHIPYVFADFEPYADSSAFEPYVDQSSTFVPYADGSTFEPYSDSSSTFDPYTDSATFELYTNNSTFEPYADGSSAFEPYGANSPTFEPYSDSSTFEPYGCNGAACSATYYPPVSASVNQYTNSYSSANSAAYSNASAYSGYSSTPFYYAYGYTPQTNYAQPTQYAPTTNPNPNTNTNNTSPNTYLPNVQSQRTTNGVDCQIYFSSIGNGPSVMLTWRALNATSGNISPSVGQVNPTSGSVAVYPSYGQMYSLTARGTGGGATCVTDPYTGNASGNTPTYYPTTSGNTQSYSGGTSYSRASSNASASAYSASAASTKNNNYAPKRNSSSVSLSQLPQTGVDYDVLLAIILMLAATSAIVSSIYILHRTGLLFVLLGVA